MKIARIDVYQYDLNYNHGVYAMSHGRSQTTEPSLVVRITTDQGVVGWSETCPHGRTYLREYFEGELAALKILSEVLIGCDPREVGILQQTMSRTMIAGMAAKGALDVACWDIQGKATGQSITSLLGGRLQDSVTVWEAIPLGSPESMLAYARMALSKGVRAFQVKVGNDPLEDAALVGALVEVIGKDLPIVADANGGWGLMDALLAVRAMKDYGILLEQPCKSMSNCAEVRRNTDMPIILDECVVTVDDLIDAKTHAGASGVNLKVGRVGGLTPARLMRDVAVELGMMVTIDDTWGGALTTAALSHLAVTTKPRSLLATSFFTEWTTPFVANGPRRRSDGSGVAPEGPGLGVQIEAAVLGAPVFSVCR